MHPDFYKRPLLFLLIALILGLLFFYKPRPSSQDVYSFVPSKDVTLVGRVEKFYAVKPKSNNVIVKVLSVDGQPANGYVYARLAEFEPLWKDTLEISGRLQEPYGINLLGNFNWQKYLSYKHVFAEIKSEQVRLIKPAPWFYRALRAVRNDILQVFADNFEPEIAHIAGGVLLGERGDLSPELFTAFQDSGAIHLLVASGGNVGFVTLITLALCGLLGFNRRKGLWVALLVAGIYTLIAGADAPLMRAYFMTLCACCGYYLGRNSGVLQGLVLSCTIILLIYPSSLFETGFQMSFLATAALIICLANYPVPAKWPRWLQFFTQIFMVTLAVQLVLLPVFTNVFYKVSLTGLLANMILVPLASLLLGLSFAYYVFTLCHVGIVLYYPTVWCLELFKYLVQGFAALPFASMPVAAWSMWAVAVYYVGLFGILHAPIKAWRRILIIAVPVTMLSLGVIGYIRENHTRVYLLNEWYKNVAIVKMKQGPVFVVGNGLSAEKVKNALHKLGRRQADAVLITDTKPSKFKYDEISSQVVYPFDVSWPTETVGQFGRVRVLILWGIHATKEGRIWYNTGYSGAKQDDVSYCFTTAIEPDFCVGAGARFVSWKGNLVQTVINETLEVEL